MDAYVAMGCQPTWTCAPYQLPERPAIGSHIAWAESNAIVFANSVLGARTGRYGDFMDICAALTGRVPLAGLHLDAERRARLVLRIEGVSDEAFGVDEFYALLGQIVGKIAGSRVAAVVGLSSGVTEDQMKALGAAAASSGAVALVARGRRDAGGADPRGVRRSRWHRPSRPSAGRLPSGLAELSTATDGADLAAVSLGTPHLSLAEFERLTPMVAALNGTTAVPLYVRPAAGCWPRPRGAAGRCLSPRRRPVRGRHVHLHHADPRCPAGSVAMTNSAKWAWYARQSGCARRLRDLEDCLASAVAGVVVRNRPSWLDG